ncbi:MAG: acetyl-CoA decarbonylase/synthase complex subunit gamma [Chloroflexi bacterium]|nr:acetyl-CoA decarbonylase/synthase complex subunit gamma [Chloroflexota bacterium]
MALSGIEIYKHLPKTNCKDCGFPTCLAFAMKLSQKSVELSACPHVSEAGKTALEAASRPPIRLVTLGGGEKKIAVGNEVVLFRHEKTFYHPPGLVVRVKDTQSLAEVEKLVAAAAGYTVERVGIHMGLDGFAIENASGNGAAFLKCVDAVAAKTTLPLVLMSSDPAALEGALAKYADRKPLIYAANKDNVAAVAALAAKHKCPVAVVSRDGLDQLSDLTEAVNKAGVEDIVLDPGARDFGGTLRSLTQLRRLALKKNFRPLGYPVITFPGDSASSPEEETLLASQHVAKYGGIVVLNQFDPSLVYPLLTMRLNIYTDPQKPIQVQPGVYQVGTPKNSSPLLISTNFSLTYFAIAGETESSGYPAWLLIVDTEGQSVLTAWAAGKFDADKIAKSVKQFDMASKLAHRSLVLPGHVAVLRGELEEALPDWKIMVGPREAVDIGGFLKRSWS